MSVYSHTSGETDLKFSIGGKPYVLAEDLTLPGDAEDWWQNETEVERRLLAWYARLTKEPT